MVNKKILPEEKINMVEKLQNNPQFLNNIKYLKELTECNDFFNFFHDIELTLEEIGSMMGWHICEDDLNEEYAKVMDEAHNLIDYMVNDMNFRGRR